MKRKIITLITAILALFVVSTNVNSTNYTATTTGAWATAATWGGSGSPVSGDNVTIPSGVTVTLGAAAACNNLTIQSGGQLSLSSTAAGAGTGYALVMDNAGVLTVAGTLYINGQLTTSGDVNITGTVKGTSTAGGTVQTWISQGTSPTISVTGTLGTSSAGTTGESIRLYLNASGTTTITGGGTIGIARLQAASASPGTGANQTIVIDNNVELRSNNAVTGQAAFSLTPTAYGSYTKTLTINANKTVKLYYPSTSFGGYQSLSLIPWNSVQGGNVTININGTLDCSAGQFNLATTTSGSSTTQNITINVGSTGSLLLGSTVRMYKPQSGQSININVADGGVIDGSTAPMTFYNTGTSALTGVSTNTSAPTTAATAAITTSTNCIYAVNGGLGGTGYTDGAAVTVTGGSGSGASIKLICNSVGAIIGYDIADGGTGYSSAPTVTLPSTAGTAATAPTLNVSGGNNAIRTISLSTAGSGYSQNGFVTVNGSYSNSQYTPCIIAKVSGGVVTGFYKLHGGNGTASTTATIIGGGAPTQWFAINGTNQTGTVKANASAYTSNPVWIGTSNSNYDPITITPTVNGVFTTNVHTTTTNFPAKYSTSINQVEWAITPTTVATADISLTPHSYSVNSTPIIAQKNTGVWVENSALFSSPTFTKTGMTLPASQNFFTTGTSGAYTVTSGTTGDWGSAATWADNVVPNTNDNVVIASGHTVTLSSTASCGNLSKTGSLITNANLTVLGSLSGSGSHTGTAKTIMTGAGVTIGAGSTGNLEIATGSTSNVITTTGDLTINGDLTVTTGKLTMGAKIYTNNISIASGAIMNADNGASSQFSRRILTVGNGTAGNDATVTVSGTLGSGTRYSNDGIDMEVNANAKTLTIGGSGGIIGIACLRPAANADSRTLDITINQNMTLNRDNGGAASIEPALTLQNNTGTYARTLTIPSGVTVTLRGNAGLHGLKNYVSGSDELLNNYASSSLNQGNCTYNVNGILDLSYNNSIFNLNTCSYAGSTQSVTVNVGSTGTLKLGNIVKMYTALTGQSASIVPVAGSTVLFNYNGTQTFLLTTGSGTAPTLPTFSNLTINNTSGVTLPSDIIINGTLSLAAGSLATGAHTLTLKGVLSGSGTIDTGASGTLAFGGTTEQTLLNTNLSGSAVNNLVVNGGSKLTLSGSAITAANFVVNSDATNGTGTLLDGGLLTVSGTTTANQYLGTARNWYVSSPVSKALAPSGFTYFSYDETGQNPSPVAPATAYWVSVATGADLNKGVGYIALPSTAGSIITFTTKTGETLNSGNIDIPLTRAGATKTGFNLIGNPYPSHLTWTKTFVDNNASKIEPTIWYRTNAGTVNSGGDAAWSFKTINASTGEAVPSGTTNIIPPMQAFWVRAVAAGTLTLNSDLTKSHQSSNPLKAPSLINIDRQRLRLEVSNGTSTDETLVYFDAAASSGYDAYDSPKMSNNNAAIPEIYTTVANENLVINGMNSIPLDTEIPLGFTTGQAGSNFSIKASQISNFDPSVNIYLKDYNDLINTPVQLTADAVYTFSSTVTTNNTSRFALIFKASSIATGINAGSNENVWISTNANNQIMINGSNGTGSVTVYNSVGQKMYSNNLSSTVNVVNTSLHSGVYLVTVCTVGKTITKRVIID